MNTFKEHVFEKEFWHNIKLVPANKLIVAKKAIETKKSSKIEIGQWKGLKIFIVDGDQVKTQHDMDFVEAGNSKAKEYIPKNEIWIDSRMDIKDLPFSAYHEIIEFFYMNAYDMDYEKAHEVANIAEKQMRLAHANI